jgi:polyisoprenyl-phosphate glycosyltransferase
MISVVVPVFNSEETIASLVERTCAVLAAQGEVMELVLVDDCSRDGSWTAMKEAKRLGNPLRIARLAKNSGQHNALLCGFSLASGDIVVTMDDDLQNPPEEIPKLVAAIRSGFDLAIGAYERKQHPAGRNLGGRMVDQVLRRIFELPAGFQLTSFRATRRSVVDSVSAMSGPFPYVTAMLLSHASRRANVPVRHEPRRVGRSNYSLSRSLSLAFNLLLNYSPYPLYFVVALCLGALGVSFALGSRVLWNVLLYGTSVPGWASMMIAISFFNGLILLALVVQGLYLLRVNQQLTHSRVGYTISEIHE